MFDEQREQSASSYLLCGMSPCAGEPPSDAPSELPPEPAKPRPDERAPRREALRVEQAALLARDVVEDPSGGGKRPAKRATAGDDDPLFQTLGRR